MKGTLTFNLPEEQGEFQLAQDGSKYLHALHAMAEDLRQKVKYEGAPPPKSWEEVRTWFWGMLKEEGIDTLEL